jgi:acetyl esterase/lipase
MFITGLLLGATYRPMETIRYCEVAGKPLSMNVFLPEVPVTPTPAMVEIHGGWFVGGEPMTSGPSELAKRGVAFFSIQYRLGDEGGFPESIRDCRNAIRFIRKNAARFNLDPTRIAVMGGSAGGYLSLMVAMVPDGFEDGGPTPGLERVSAKVCGAFSWIPPTDLLAFWNQGPEDVVIAPDGTKTYRHWNNNVPNDARPHLRSLFHGVSPASSAGKKLYERMSPTNYVRRGLPPLLICDGEHDPIVPGLMGRDLDDSLKKIGASSTYWMSHGGHAYPSGDGFASVLDQFLNTIYRE